jgi:hypothetical protein
MNIWEIYLIDFPFTDGKWIKKRPCLIISIDKQDIEVLFITTQKLDRVYEINKNDFVKWWLKINSYIRLNKWILFHKELFLKHKYIWTLKKEIIDDIFKQVIITYTKQNFDTKALNCIKKCINL